MSLATPQSPRSDQLSFLPHAPRSPTTSFHLLSQHSSHPQHPQHAQHPQHSQSSRPRSNTASSNRGLGGAPGMGWSKSEPNSPSGRSHHPSGLAPLSTISPIRLDASLPITQPLYISEQQQQQQQQSTTSLTTVKPQRQQSAPIPIQQAHSRTSSIPNTSPRQFAQSQPHPQMYTSHIPSQPLTNPAAHMSLPAPRLLSRLKRPQNEPSSSSSETETEVDSDSTFVPGRSAVRQKQSLSQPDLTALRSRLEGWAGGVAKGQLEERRAREARRKTPPARPPIPLNTQSSPGVITASQASKSNPSLTALRTPSSPRHSPGVVTPMTPVLSSSSDGSSPRIISDPLGGVTGSEDADDDFDDTGTSSPSSGSLTFSPKRSRGLRQRTIAERSKGGLGLTLGPETPPAVVRREEPIPVMIERKLQRSSLLSLRLLAIVPSYWGICVLFQAFVNGGLWEDVWPWGVDLSTEALERLVTGGTSQQGTFKPVNRGDMVLAIAWAVCTAHFCFRLTTGLTHRWRSYYSLPSTLTRLLSLQCLCWPATYLTLWFLGAQRPLFAWIVIGVTTGWTRTVQMWVTSNVVPGEVTPRARPEGLAWWEEFTWGRKWDWDDIAREVGWKVGGLLLVTTAWLFWGIETGRLVEVI